MSGRVSRRELGPLILRAMWQLGNSARTAEIDARVILLGKFTEEQQRELSSNQKANRLKYHVAWARTDLKRIGALENSARGVWRLTKRGRNLTESECVRLFRSGR